MQPEAGPQRGSASGAGEHSGQQAAAGPNEAAGGQQQPNTSPQPAEMQGQPQQPAVAAAERGQGDSDNPRDALCADSRGLLANVAGEAPDGFQQGGQRQAASGRGSFPSAPPARSASALRGVGYAGAARPPGADLQPAAQPRPGNPRSWQSLVHQLHALSNARGVQPAPSPGRAGEPAAAAACAASPSPSLVRNCPLGCPAVQRIIFVQAGMQANNGNCRSAILHSLILVHSK
jgi:hypothetical protein